MSFTYRSYEDLHRLGVQVRDKAVQLALAQADTLVAASNQAPQAGTPVLGPDSIDALCLCIELEYDNLPDLFTRFSVPNPDDCAPMLETLPLLRAEMPAEFWPVVLMEVSAPAPVPLSTAMVPASEASRPCESWPAVSMRSDPLVRTLPLCVAWMPSDVSPRVLIVLTSGPLPMDTVPLVRATTPWELAPAVSMTRPPLV